MEERLPSGPRLGFELVDQIDRGEETAVSTGTNTAAGDGGRRCDT